MEHKELVYLRVFVSSWHFSSSTLYYTHCALSRATFQPSNRSANIRLTRFIKGLRGQEMHKSRSAALIALVALALTACNGASQNSNQSNRTGSILQPRTGKWIPQFRSEYSKSISGTNLAVFSYSSLSVVSADIVCAAGEMPDPENQNRRVGVFIRTTDGGRTWEEKFIRLPGLTDPALNSMSFISADTGWIVGVNSRQEAIVLKTTDGGESWEVTKPGVKQIPTTVFFADENRGWMGGVTMMPRDPSSEANLQGQGQKQAGKVARTPEDDEDEDEQLEGGPSDILATTDGGKTWQQQRRIASSLVEIFFLDKNTGWAAGYNGVIYHTVNGGQLWTQQRSELEPLEQFSAIQDDRLLRFALYGIHFFDEQTGMAAAMTFDNDAGRVLATTNGGEVWARRWIVGDAGVRDVVMTTKTEAYAVISNGKFVYRTVNGGVSWLAEPIEFEQDMTFFRLGAADPSKIWASAGGAIFHRVEP